MSIDILTVVGPRPFLSFFHTLEFCGAILRGDRRFCRLVG